jgi:Na+(H+)/acetate symporter ActP
MHIDPWILTFSAATVLVTIWMGFWSAKKSKTASDFFVAGRSVSVGWNASAISGEYLSAASFMGVAGMVMSSGYDALWYPVCYACGYLFLLLFIAGPLRRFGAYTIPDFAEGRFDSPLFRKIAVVFVLFIGFFYTMPQMKGAGTTLSYIFQDLDLRGTALAFLAPHEKGEALKGLHYGVGVFLVAAVITLNVALGGMKGITLVQAFQYWAKMFAISVPIFVLMAVYGHYGKQVGGNGRITVKDWSAHLVFDGTNYSVPADERSVMEKEDLKSRKQLEPEGFTSAPFVAAERTITVELPDRKPLPSKAPRDETWLNPFGPLTTKAASAANAISRWNLSSTIRSTLVDYLGRPPPTSLESMVDSVEHLVEGKSRGKSGKNATPQFADWTNMPPNTSRALAGGFPMLSTLHEFGLLLERPVLVATNLPRPRLVISGSFQTRDQFLKYLDSVFLTNGVRLDMRGDDIKAIPAADWDRYMKNPASVVFVPNQIFSMRQNVEPRILAMSYGELLGRHALMPANLPTNAVDFNPTFEVLLAHETKARMEQTLKEAGITIIPAGGNEIWAVPKADLARYKLPPVDPRLLSLLYTYSLIIALVCGTAGLPHILVRFYTNPDGVAAKRTTMWVMILIGVFYLFPPVFGVMGRNLMPSLYEGAGAKGTDKVVLELPRVLDAHSPAHSLTGSPSSAVSGSAGEPVSGKKRFPWGSILSGITCAGAFAAFMSTFSGLLVSMTGALAHDVYGRIFRPKSTAEQRLRMFKLCTVIVGGGAMLLGFLVESFEINKMVGWAFAIAATSYFPLLFLSTWWRGITMKGAATGMLAGGTLSLVAIASTMFADQAAWAAGLKDYYAAHPLLRILAEQPAIWALPLAMSLMFVLSKLTAKEVPADIRMKMLVLHAPERLGLKQEYIQEHQQGH